LALQRQQSLFRVRRRIQFFVSKRSFRVRLALRLAIDVALLQGEVMRYTENPAAKVSARFPKLQVPKERQEDFLGNFLSVKHG
jgi:hypothetical protein